MPDGTYRSEIWNDGLGTPLRYPVTVTVQGDSMEIDFAGAPPQPPRDAGSGDPRKRPLELIHHDLDHGDVTERAVTSGRDGSSGRGSGERA